MASTQRFNTAYGLSQPLLNEFPAPIISQRDPTAADKAQLGSVWVNKPSNSAFVITSVVNNIATWIDIGGGSGTFTSLTVTPGNITATNGNIIATLGSLSAGTTVSAGTSISAGTTITAGTGITATTGNITATAGNFVATAGTATIHGTITSSTGNIVATAGAVSAGTTVIAGTGITATTGNIVASTGNINASMGNINATVGNITATAGNITATVGEVVAGGIVEGQSLVATGDSGGFSLSTTVTGVVNTTQSTGTLSILSGSTNNGNNTGFIKMYVGTTAVFIPYFATIAP